jgi:hypothetical protein
MDKLKLMYSMGKGWLMARLGERTSWDGGILVAVCGGYLVLGGLIDLVAWAGLLYGAWTIWKAESSK